MLVRVLDVDTDDDEYMYTSKEERYEGEKEEILCFI